MAEDIVRTSIQIDIDTASAVAQLRTLESQISQFNSRIISSNDTMRNALNANTKALRSQIGDIGQFSTEIKTMQTSVGRFSAGLEKGKLSFGEYFRYGLASTKKFGSAFSKELDTINAVAEDRVKRISTRYVGLGKEIGGMQKVLAIRPEILPEGLNTNLAMAAQRQQIFNQLLRQGSTHLVNWGKNTQWAGRQLMVGFTVPLSIFGGLAAKTFMDLERQAVSFRRVYGDAFTPVEETDAMLDQIGKLSSEFTKYGIAVTDTMNMAAKAAATGAQGADLIAATTEATRLATLGQIDQQQALDATIALQSAFTLNTQELAESVDFLNAVENQTIVSLDDVTQAIPRAASVVQGLGGDVQTLSAFLAAMRENGVNAAEGANALKSGLASLINPTKQAREQLEAVGIDINTIIETNRGDLLGTVQAFGRAVNALDPLTRQQTLAQVFGKYQFARLGALFENIVKDGSQASRVLELMGEDVSSLAALSEKELGSIEDAIGVKFQGAVERLKLAIAPIGEIFLKIATPVVEAATKMLNAFNNMPDALKNIAVIATVALAGIAPVFLMGLGLIANGLGNLAKGVQLVSGIYQRLTGKITGSTGPLTQSFGFLQNAELDAAAAAGTLNSNLSGLTATALINRSAIDDLTGAYTRFSGVMQQRGGATPQGMMLRPPRMRGMAKGGFVEGRGNKDSEPALLMPGEFVMNKEASQKYAPILAAMNQGSIAGYAKGRDIQVPGGGSVRLNLPDKNTQKAEDAILRRLQAASEIGAEALERFVRVLQGMTDEVEVTSARIDEAVRQIPEISSIASPERTGAPTSIQRQSTSATWETKGAEISAIQSEVADKWPQISEDTKKMRNLTNTQASHLEVINAAGERVDRDWTDLANITPDLGAMNNYLNRVKGITLAAEDLERIMKETGLSQAQVETEIDKLRREIHPITTEAQKVYVSIARLDEELSLAAGGLRAGANVKTRIGTVAQTGYQATAVAAAGEARLAAPAGQDFVSTIDERQYRESGLRIAQAVNEGIQQGNPGSVIEQEVMQNAKAASPPPWSYLLGDWIADGINAGMQQGIQQPTLSPSQMRGAVMLGGGTQIPQLPINTEAQKQIEALGLSAGRAAVANEKDATASILDANAHIDNAAATNQETKEKRRGAGGFRSLLYAADGLSLAMSFLPGPLGEIANKVFIASAALTAFDSIMRIQIIEGALKKFGIALSAAAAASGLKTAGKGVTSAVSTGADVATAAALARSAGPAGKVGGIFAKMLGPITKVTAIFGKLLPALGRLALGLTRFLGIIVNGIPLLGQVVSAILLVGSTLLAFKFAYDHTGNQIKDLGNAAKIAGDDLKSIAERFGFTARETGFANAGTLVGRTQEAQTVSQEARQFVSEDSAMQARVGTIGGATDVQAEAVFRSMFMDLLAGGASRDVATAIVEAVAIEAGKKEVFVPVSLELSAGFTDDGKIKQIADFIKSNLKPGIDELQQSLSNLSEQGFNQAIDQGAIDDARRWMASVEMLPEFIKAAVVPQYEQKKAILETASSFELLKSNSQAAMNMLSAQFITGEIGAKKFNTGMQQIEQSLMQLPNNQGLAIMKQQLTELYPESEATVGSITDASVAFDILSLQAQGVNMSGFIQQMANAGVSADVLRDKLDAVIFAQSQISSAQSDIARIEKALAEEKAKPTGKKGTPDKTGSGGGSKDPFAAREDEMRDEQAQITIDEIKIDRTAEDRFDRELQDRFGDTSINVGGVELPLDSIADSEYAITMIGESIEDLERGPIKKWEDAIEGLNKEIKVYQDQIDDINRTIELQEQAIEAVEREYKPILDSLNEQREAQEDILQGLEDQMDAATRPYENQIALLEKQKRVAEEAARPRLEALEEEEKALDVQTDALDEQIKYIDEQKDALSKVAKINDNIARQQKNRLSLTQALAEGDIYAATAAANEMKNEAANQASEQQENAFDAQKDSLEKQKELIDDRRDAIEDERDAIQAGLDVIQKQIDAQEYQKFLIEDTYRLSMQAANDQITALDREISRQEAAKDARTKPYRDIIDKFGPQLTALNNSIYDKEEDIKKIEEDQLVPLQSQIDKLNDQKDILDDINGDIQIALDKEKLQLEERKKYLDQELQILSAKREIANLPSGGGGGGGTEGTPNQQDADKIKALEIELAAARKRLMESQEGLPEAGTEDEASWYTGLIEGAKSAWTNFTSWFGENVIDPVKAKWQELTTWFDTNVIQPIKTAWATISDNVRGVTETIAALFVALWQIIDETFITPLRNAWNAWYDQTVQPKLDALAAAWEIVRAAFVTKFNEIKIFFTTWWSTSIQPKLDLLKDIWETVRIEFAKKFGEISTFFTTWWSTSIQPKIDAIVNVWETVKQGFITKFTEIGAWWDEWKKLTFDAKVEAMKSGLQSLFDPDTWKGWFSKAMDGLLAVGKTLVNNLVRLFNSIKIKIPTDIGGVPIPIVGGREFGFNTPDPYPGYNAGGMVKYGMGGIAGDGSRDSIQAMLTPGEFVIRKAMVDKYGSPMLKAINQGSFTSPRFDTSGTMGSTMNVRGEPSSTNVVAPMYNNYSVSVNVSGTNASADEIANRTITKIKQMQNTSIRSGRG